MLHEITRIFPFLAIYSFGFESMWKGNLSCQNYMQKGEWLESLTSHKTLKSTNPQGCLMYMDIMYSIKFSLFFGVISQQLFSLILQIGWFSWYFFCLYLFVDTPGSVLVSNDSCHQLKSAKANYSWGIQLMNGKVINLQFYWLSRSSVW